MEDKKRTKIVKVAVNKNEHESLREKANGPISPYLRNVGLGSSFKTITKLKRIYLPADPDLLRSVSYIGNNINQIAKAINIAKKSNQDIDSLKILFELNKITDLLEELKEANWHAH